MKVITIGRDPSCNIVINDPEISRRHAIVRVSDFGKIEIVDLSTNGTSVNGNPLRKNVPYPVTRKNQVTFAGVSKLNWDDIPNPAKFYKLIAYSIAGLVAVALIIVAITRFTDSHEDSFISQPPTEASTQSQEPASKGEPKVDSKIKKVEPENAKDETNTDVNRLLKKAPTAPTQQKAESRQQSNGKKSNNQPSHGSSSTSSSKNDNSNTNSASSLPWLTSA